MSGGLVLGPMGLALGGAVGGALAAYIAQDRFKPLLEVILVDMKQDQRDRMVQGLRNVLTNVGTVPHLVASQAEVTIPNNVLLQRPRTPWRWWPPCRATRR